MSVRIFPSFWQRGACQCCGRDIVIDKQRVCAMCTFLYAKF